MFQFAFRSSRSAFRFRFVAFIDESDLNRENHETTMNELMLYMVSPSSTSSNEMSMIAKRQKNEILKGNLSTALLLM